MPQPTRFTADVIDLSPRFFFSTTVAASPSAATETTICTLTVSGDLTVVKGIQLIGWFGFTVGTSGTAVTTKIRRTDTSGTTVATSGAQNVTAADIRFQSIQGIDTGPTLPGQVYVLTLTVTAGAAASTVSAVSLTATVY